MMASYRICKLTTCTRPCHRDAATGIMHDFCGRTHAAQDAANRDELLSDPHGICHMCKLSGCEEPVYFDHDTGRVHEFCCKSHADEAMSSGQHPRPNKNQQLGRHIDPTQKCALPGCTARKYIDPNSPAREFDYCGRSHARLAAARGLEPPPIVLGSPASFGVTFSGRGCSHGCAVCTDVGDKRGNVCGVCEPSYTLSTLTNAHPKYDTIKRQFHDSWLMPGPKPTVLRVLQVRNPAPTFARFEQYKQELATQGRPVNEVRRFHATSMACSFGITQSQRPCSDVACAVCSIAEMSFKLDLAGGGTLTQNFGYLRYGRGLYFSKTSSKSNDYGGDTERLRGGQRLRVMFLCKVALGSPLREQRDRLDEQDVDRCIAARRKGGAYDSVVGLTVADGGALNYEENVVYSEAAAVPSYLIVYQL